MGKRRVELRLAERISLEAICRIMEIKQHQPLGGPIYRYMDKLYQEIPSHLACLVPENAEIELVELNCKTDELWSFIGHKATSIGYG